MLKWLLVITFAFFVFMVLASNAKGDIANVSTVKYKSGDEEVAGILALPSGKGPFPAIILIHEWWGLNDWLKSNAQHFAEKGYVALAIDLYRGKVADSPDLAHELMRGVPEDRSERDLLAAVSYLRTRKDVNPKKIGAIGWCMGGGYSLKLALKQPELTAAVICYGSLATDKTALSKIGASICGIFGGKDRGIPVEGVRQFESSLKEFGKKVETHIYNEAGHAFMNPNNKSGYRQADAKDAWSKIDAFFEQTLE